MAINPSQPLRPPFLPPNIAQRAQRVAQAQFTLPTETTSATSGFEQATQQFGESIQALSPTDRKEIQIIHSAVDEWASGKTNPDRLGQFTVRVMLYMDERLKGLEASGNAQPGECQSLEKVFTSGFRMVQLYTSTR